jgi:hypothetical protein
MLQLEFEKSTHVYRYGGKIVPSVTQVMAPLIDFSMVDPEILEAARQFGQHCHEACHLFDTGELVRDTLDPLLAPYVDAWGRFLDQSGAVVIASEQSLMHLQLGYAGTPDRVLDWGRFGVAIPDLKFTATVPKTVGVQTAAYAKAYASFHGLNKEPVRVCIHLHGDGSYHVHRRQELSDWSYFLSCLNVWKFNHGT